MFEPTVTVIESHEQKDVSIEICRGTQEAHVLFANGLEIVTYAAHIGTCSSANSNRVRNTVYFEFADRKIADFHRVVDQLGIVIRFINAITVFTCGFRPHGRNDPPVAAKRPGSRLNFQLACMVFLSDNGWKYAWPVEIRVSGIEVCAAHILLVRIDFSD